MVKINFVRATLTLNKLGPDACFLLEEIFDNWLHQSWSNFVWDYIQKRLDKSVKVIEIGFYNEIDITLDVPSERFDVHALEAKLSSIETEFISEFCFDGAILIYKAKQAYLGRNSVEFHHVKATNGKRLHARWRAESIFTRKLTRYLCRFANYQQLMSA